jgi:hypothetical protein
MNQEQIRFDKDLNEYLEKNFGGQDYCSCDIEISEDAEGETLVIIGNQGYSLLELYDFNQSIYLCPKCQGKIKTIKI